MCMCVCVCLSLSVCACVCACACVCIRVRVFLYGSTHMSICTVIAHTCTHTHTLKHTHTCVHVCIAHDTECSGNGDAQWVQLPFAAPQYIGLGFLAFATLVCTTCIDICEYVVCEYIYKQMCTYMYTYADWAFSPTLY